MIPEGSTDVTLRLSDDGIIEVYTGGCELGQGLVDVLSRITSRALDLPQALDFPVLRIRIIPGSTDYTTSRMLTSASQQVFLTGGAIFRAAVKFKRQLFQSAAQGAPKTFGLSGIENRWGRGE